MKRIRGAYTGLFTIGITALFFAGFMLLIIFGAQSYQSIVERQDSNMSSRASLSYIAACVRAYDTEGAVDIRATGYGDTLVLAEAGTDYGLFIYLHDGHLMEQYVALDSDPDAERAELICDTDVFTVTEKQPGLLSVSTDDGSILLHQRSEGGAGS